VLRDAPISAYVPVSNVARGRQFYEGVLQQQPRDVTEAGVLYECGNGSTFFMYVSDGAGTSRASTAFWSVADVEKEVAELKERAVAFERDVFPGMEGEIATAGGAKAAWFKDPDGNVLALIQPVG
jgi:catechol 2,3-dioxygenase-like lactoylglutathione lyase family enzyme